MSNIYHSEPPTQGKVLLKTSYGDIDIELWPKEAPLACRNFLQLCMEGYYDNTPVNRVIKDFMVQFGDPTGTGAGGESIWGRPFKDEVHGRILFNHRGQLAMANENKPNSNHSQFFLTLAPCEWLNRKHTIFGKVTGSTIFNLLRMGDAEVDDKEHPAEPITLVGVEILWNPFDDIIPRDLSKKASATAGAGVAGSTSASQSESGKGDDAKKKVKATKDLKLLSFGEEEEEDSTEAGVPRGIISSHDSKQKSKKFSTEVDVELQRAAEEAIRDKQTQPKPTAGVNVTAKPSSAQGTRSQQQPRGGAQQADQSLLKRIWGKDAEGDIDEGAGGNDAGGFQDRMKAKMLERRKTMEQKGVVGSSISSRNNNGGSTTTAKKPTEGDEDADNNDDDGDDDDLEDLMRSDNNGKDKDVLKEKALEFQKLREGLLRSKRAIQVITGAEAEKIRKDQAFHDMVSPLEQRRQKYSKRKNEFGSRQDDTLVKLAKFTNSLKSTKKSDGDQSKEEEMKKKKKEVESYNGQILEEDDDGKEDLGDWHQGKLKFKKHIDDQYRMGGDGRSIDDYAIIDSRNTSSSSGTTEKKNRPKY